VGREDGAGIDRGDDVRITRAERVEQVQSRLALGWMQKQIAEDLGLNYRTISGYVNDPTGAKERERMRRNQGTCEVCGAQTSGSNGRAKAPTRCFRCAHPLAPCGTPSAYNRGCRCDACRAAHAERMRPIMRARRARMKANG
jgi:hypothetical protein